MEKKKLVKALHVCLGLPVNIFDDDLNLVKSFKSNRTISLHYNFHAILKAITKQTFLYQFVTGDFGELLLVYQYQDCFFSFGPFRCNHIDETLPSESKINQLPLYSLTDIREILIIIHYVFSGEVFDLSSEKILHTVQEAAYKIDKEQANYLIEQSNDPKTYLVEYENNILEAMRQGDVQKLRDMLFNLGNGVSPAVTGSILRSEKNYSIIVYEKISQIAIQLGVSIVTAYQSRDYFIQESEKCNSLESIIQLRESAIIFFTKKIGENTCNYSRLVTSIIQYINTNLNQKLKTKNIATHFNFSESAIRKLFQDETNVTIQQFITKRKIEEAKTMLRNRHSVTDIAIALAFSDIAHFSKIFKNEVGIPPKQYQKLFHSK
ncbi:YSIRK-targeted surface antigen transcriptional regulator [Streptococcus phocae]|uniref:HTH araC/xylS-type domain-containing protein n=1 Tax=Streptococcus phocae TaxID=119224 RepID=A0A0P6SM12_9STRE|nr:YSIRK-targeted surface antigen transcriptional regulator [Streptococcus phocae]KPJ22514.1 hypothetical protein AKK44_04570 [Streptococcus phocae]